MDYTIIHNQEKNRFETTVDGLTAELAYRIQDHSVYEYYHTGVPKELEGRGIGSELVRYALEFARLQNWKIKPTCPFVRSYIEKHTQYQDILFL